MKGTFAAGPSIMAAGSHACGSPHRLAAHAAEATAASSAAHLQLAGRTQSCKGGACGHTRTGRGRAGEPQLNPELSAAAFQRNVHTDFVGVDKLRGCGGLCVGTCVGRRHKGGGRGRGSVQGGGAGDARFRERTRARQCSLTSGARVISVWSGTSWPSSPRRPHLSTATWHDRAEC